MSPLTDYFQTDRRLAIAVSVVSAAALATAYIAQYGFGLKPCILCLYQRVPYALNVVFGLLAFLATFRYPRIASLLLLLAALTFFAGAGISGFHAGVEYGWWKGLASCGGDILPQGASIEELRRALIQQKDIVRCDQAAWTLFGISMAGYNFAVSVALGCGAAFQLRKIHGA